MQRLIRLHPQLNVPALAMVKEAGTPVDFTNAREIGLKTWTFLDDVFGLYAYQGAPVTVDVATRDAFFNGALEDLQTQAAGQGMEIQYIRITWNETQQNGGYYITDLVVGVVTKVTRDYNTGPDYLRNSLKAVGWFNQMVSKMVMPWQSWLLLTPTQTEAYNSWYWEAVSDSWKLEARLGDPIPDPPSIYEVKNVVTPEANAALGTFTTKIIDEGFTPTILGRRVQVCYQISPEYVTRWFTHGRVYRTHVRFSWDFKTDPEFTAEDAPLFVITGTFIFGLILVIGGLIIVGVVAYTFFNNVTTEKSGYIQYAVLRDAEGNPILDDEGNPITYIDEEGWQEGPPNWWADVIPTVVLGGLAIAGLAIVAPSIIKSLRKK